MARAMFRWSPDGGEGGGGEGGEGEQGAAPVADDRLNKAISTHLSRFRKSYDGQLQETISKALDPIVAKLAALEKPPEPEPTSRKKSDGGDDDRIRAAAEAARKEYESRVAELERKTHEAEERAQLMESKRTQDEERSALTEALRAAGVQQAQMRAAVALLYNEDQRIGRAKDDNGVIFKVQQPGYVEEVSLEDGLKEWLKTEEGKSFLPPRGAAGSGATGSQATRRRANGREERLAEARRVLLEASGAQVIE